MFSNFHHLISLDSLAGNCVGTVELALFRAASRHRRFSARQSSTVMHKISSEVRKWEALANEMLTPLNSATYAATQRGHLGSKTSVAPGMIHPAISPPRRQRDTGRRASS